MVRSRHFELPATERFVTSLIGPRKLAKPMPSTISSSTSAACRDEDFLFLNFEELL